MSTFLCFWVFFFVMVHDVVSKIIVKYLGNIDPVDQFVDEEAYFGPSISDDIPLSGRLFLSQPIEGCVESIPMPDNESFALPFIALIKRGNCSFDYKVRAAETGQYAGAIIFNDVNDEIFHMSSRDDNHISIPSVMVGLSAGLKLQHHYCYPPNRYIIEVYANREWDLQTYIIPVIALVGLFLVGVAVLGAFRFCEQRRRRQRRCLTGAQLKQLPLKVYAKGEIQSETCAICLEDYVEGDKVRILPCDHVYHSKCIDPWLLKGRRVCPICKRALFRRRDRRRSLFQRFRSAIDRDAENQQLLSDSDSIDDSQSSQNVGPSTSYGTMESTVNPLSAMLPSNGTHFRHESASLSDHEILSQGTPDVANSGGREEQDRGSDGSQGAQFDEHSPISRTNSIHVQTTQDIASTPQVANHTFISPGSTTSSVTKDEVQVIVHHSPDCDSSPSFTSKAAHV